MKFQGKWMELGSALLSKVAQTQEEKNTTGFLLFVYPSSRSLDASPWAERPADTRKVERDCGERDWELYSRAWIVDIALFRRKSGNRERALTPEGAEEGNTERGGGRRNK